MAVYMNNITDLGGGTLTVELTQGYYAIVDDIPQVRLILQQHHFIADVMPSNKQPYAVAGVYDPSTQKQHRVYLHQFLMPKIPGRVIDHINRNTLVNRMANLRNVTRTVNSINAKLRKANKTGIAGLTRILTRPAWNVKWQESTGVSRQKGFLDSKYGGKEESQRAATTFLLQQKKRLPHYIEGNAVL